MKKISGIVLLGTGLIFFMNLFICCNQKKKQNTQGSQYIPEDSVAIPEPILKYGLPVDSFLVTGGVVKRHQHLSSILSEFGVNMVTIDRIAKGSKPVFSSNSRLWMPSAVRSRSTANSPARR